MELSDKMRKDWILFMSEYVDGDYNIRLYAPEKYKENTYFIKSTPKINIRVNVVEKFTRSVKVEFSIFDKEFSEIIYLPTSKSLQNIIDITNIKITKIINEYLMENHSYYIEEMYDEHNKKFVEIMKKVVNKDV